MKPQKIKINFELIVDEKNDTALYQAIKCTPLEDCGALLRQYIDTGVSAEFTEYYIQARIDAAISNYKKTLKFTTSEQQI